MSTLKVAQPERPSSGALRRRHGILIFMRIIAAHVRSGAIVPDEETDLPDGAAVTVLADTDASEFDVPADVAVDLVAALDEADRGEVVPPSVLARLRG